MQHQPARTEHHPLEDVGDLSNTVPETEQQRQVARARNRFKICEACNGEEAVAKAKEMAPDLAILDVRMPGLNGIEVAGILRYAQPRIRIVFLTMYAEELSESVTDVFQVDAVLSKAGGLAQVVESVENLLVAPVG